MKTFLVLTLFGLYSGTLNLTKAESDISSDEEEPISFTFAAFSEIDRDRLNFMLEADIQANLPGIELTPRHAPLVNAMVDGNEKGKVFYKDSIQMKAKTGHKIVSFATSFTFIIKSANYSNTGDGLAFVLADDPYFEGDEAGQFGIFKVRAATSPTIAVEFDTFLNEYLKDIDANHVGIDIDSALSLMSESASTVNISLQQGIPITAWIDYSADRRDIEVRISKDRTKPIDPLIKGFLDLSKILASEMWVGFSASTHILAHQSHEITYWTFECDSFNEGHNSPLDEFKRFWKTSSSYGVVAGGTAVLMLLIMIVTCCCCSPCCKKHCPCFAKCCSCCPRWCPCHLYTKTHDKESPSLCTNCTCSPCLSNCCCSLECSSPNCNFSCKNCCGLSPCCKCFGDTKTPPPEKPVDQDEKKAKKKKPCPVAFFELIQEDVSEEKDIDLKLQESIQACLPVENPFSTKNVVQPGCMKSLLFGADSDDEIQADVSAPGPFRSLGSPIMVSNTVFDIPPEEMCQCPEHCQGRGKTSSAANRLVGNSSLIEGDVQQQKPPDTPPTRGAEVKAEPRGRKMKSRETESYDYSQEEQIAMGWGYFSP